MEKRVNVFVASGIVAALLLGWAPAPSFADGDTDDEDEAAAEWENRWVASVAILGGANFQDQEGDAVSSLTEGSTGDTIALQPDCELALDPNCEPVPIDDSDFPVVPFVGGSVEVMSPALPLPARPRFFLSGEVFASFASQRTLAVEGDPDCVRGPEPDAICAKDEDGSRIRPFGEDSANGQGIRTKAEVDTLVYGARFGVSFPFRLGERQLRIKPSAAWTSYEVETRGFVVNAACDPVSQCTDVTSNNIDGFLRQPELLSAKDSQRFHALGPSIDLEMDTGRFGPIGSAIFLGGGAYRVLGDRSISFQTFQEYDDRIGQDRADAKFEVEVERWLYRAHVGVRLFWVGFQQ